MRRWVTAQQIGLLAYWFREYVAVVHKAGNDDGEGLDAKRRDRLRFALEAKLDDHGWRPDELRTMPPVTLYLLRNVGAGNLSPEFAGELPGLLSDAINEIVEGRRALISRVKDWVHHLLHTSGDPMRIARLGDLLFRAPASIKPEKGRSRWRDI